MCKSTLICRYQSGKASIVDMTGIQPEFEEFRNTSMENANLFYRYMIDTSKSLIYRQVITGLEVYTLLLLVNTLSNCKTW